MTNRASRESSHLYTFFRAQVKQAMKREGLTQWDVAMRTGMHQPTVSLMLSGKQSNPTLETMNRMAQAVNCILQIKLVRR